MRSNWLPFYRPFSFASQPFDCFAEDIQFCIFFTEKNLKLEKALFLRYTRQKQRLRNSKQVAQRKNL
mgnify:CR=1 FL=1